MLKSVEFWMSKVETLPLWAGGTVEGGWVRVCERKRAIDRGKRQKQRVREGCETLKLGAFWRMMASGGGCLGNAWNRGWMGLRLALCWCC